MRARLLNYMEAQEAVECSQQRSTILTKVSSMDIQEVVLPSVFRHLDG